MVDDNDTFTRQTRLIEQLANSPIVEVLGVVAPRGAAGGRSGSEKLWTFMVTFVAWRVAGGGLQTGPLEIRRRMTERKLNRLRSKIEPYAVVRIRARVGDSPLGGHHALLEAFVGVDASDAALNHHAEQLQKPVTFRDPTFGRFTLDRRADWFTAEVVWDGQAVSLNLSESSKVREGLKAARELWQNQSEWNHRIRDYAVKELLRLKNDNWLDEDEAPLTPDEFKNRMTLESITVYPDGSFDFWHDDGDLFFGHSILIRGDL